MGKYLAPSQARTSPSGTFSVGGLDLVGMRQGRMAAHWGFIDTDAMARQLGLAHG